MDVVLFRHIDSPLGAIMLAAGSRGLKSIGFTKGKPPSKSEPDWIPVSSESERTAAGRALTKAASQLEEYFSGARCSFDLPLNAGGNEFQQRVWKGLCEIPYGETWSYGKLAERIGRPGAARAVGSANSRNPLPIVVPCHRVIGANGTLTGYAGGLHIKAFLLELELAHGDSKQTVLL